MQYWNVAKKAAAVNRRARALGKSCVLAVESVMLATFGLLGRVVGVLFASEAAMRFFDWTIRDEEDD